MQTATTAVLTLGPLRLWARRLVEEIRQRRRFTRTLGSKFKSSRGPWGGTRKTVAADTLWSRKRLLALTVASSVVEAALLWVFGVTSALALAPQASAPAPFATFHDLRFLFVYHDSWVSFGL
jgi:hypothetical protein